MSVKAKPRPFTLEELRAYLVEIFPQVWAQGDYAIEEVGPMTAAVRLNYHPGSPQARRHDLRAFDVRAL